jgi:hypothetical protein
MTFIAGFNCYDGIVICSDSLESDNLNRRMVKKLFHYEVEGQWGVCFGCSGNGATCSTFTDKLLSLVKKQVAYDRSGIEELIKGALSYMKKEYPAEDLEVIVGLWGMKPLEARLYKATTQVEPLYIESQYCCAGNDVSLARFLIDSVFVVNDPLPSDDRTNSIAGAAQIGMFVTAVMKEKAHWVGGPTQLMMYRLGEKAWDEAMPDAIGVIENRRYLIGDIEEGIRKLWRERMNAW